MGTIHMRSIDRAVSRSRLAIGARFKRALERTGAALLDWHCRQQQRRTLMQLDERMLRDMGISRADAEHEAAKPFWRP